MDLLWFSRSTGNHSKNCKWYHFLSPYYTRQQVAVTTLTEQLAAQLQAHPRGIRSLPLCSVGKMPLTNENVLLLALLIKKKRPRGRTMRVHPMLAGRKEAVLYDTLFDELCNFENNFINYFEMSRSSWWAAKLYHQEDIRRPHTKMRKLIITWAEAHYNSKVKLYFSQ